MPQHAIVCPCTPQLWSADISCAELCWLRPRVTRVFLQHGRQGYDSLLSRIDQHSFVHICALVSLGVLKIPQCFWTSFSANRFAFTWKVMEWYGELWAQECQIVSEKVGSSQNNHVGCHLRRGWSSALGQPSASPKCCQDWQSKPGGAAGSAY